MKILLILLLISFKSYAYFEIGLSYGRTFNNKVETLTAKDGGSPVYIDQADIPVLISQLNPGLLATQNIPTLVNQLQLGAFLNSFKPIIINQLNGNASSIQNSINNALSNVQIPPLHSPGVKANLANNPNGSNVFGIDATMFFNKYVGLNVDFRYSKYRIDTGNITLTESNGSVLNTSFPGFDVKTYAFKPSLILQNHYKNFTYYGGIGYNFVYGIFNNTKFSIVPSKYGLGGKETGMFMTGLGLKAGLSYKMYKNMKIGLEYNWDNYYIKDTNQQFRSFNTGFSGSFVTNSIVFKTIFMFN
jgi:opacity protein-like surface antigen